MSKTVGLHSRTLYMPQICRGLACLTVALFHGQGLVGVLYGVYPEFGVYKFGFFGVHLFFVISGLIILHAHYEDSDNYRNIPFYFFRRMIRIYPLYLIVFVIGGGWKILAGKIGVAEFFSNALFFYSPSQKLTVRVAWTLAYEMAFYLIFVAFIANKRLGVWVFGGWFSTIILNHIYGFSDIVPLKVPNLLFFIGMLSSVAVRKLKNGVSPVRGNCPAYFFIAAGILFFVTTALYCVHLWGEHDALTKVPFDPYGNLVITAGFGFGSAFLLISAFSANIESFLQKRRLLLAIGNASYSIYLVHFQIQRLIIDGARSIQSIWLVKTQSIAYLLLLLAILVSVSLGILIHKLIEKPLLTSLGRLLARANIARR